MSYIQDFVPRLLSHIHRRYRGDKYDGNEDELPMEDLQGIIIQHGRIYSHATACFNYTTYDVRREQDTINVHNQRCDILLRSYEDEDDASGHPYWYARVLGIFHARFFFPGVRHPQRYDFLWVRWFGQDTEWTAGTKAMRLDRIGFVPQSRPNVFGFVDPANIVRACHLIPAFNVGRTRSLLGPSLARDSPEGDWENYYVMRYVRSIL